MDRATPDLGRHLVTKREEHKGAFKTPTLRDVARRLPTCTTAACCH
jgi:cytochrome c peroxidase